MIICRARKKREAKIKRDVKRGVREPNEQNPFEIFVTVTDIRYTCVHLNSSRRKVDIPLDIIKNLTVYWETHMECVSCKISRQSPPIF